MRVKATPPRRGEDEDDDGNNADNIDDWGFGSVESREER